MRESGELSIRFKNVDMRLGQQQGLDIGGGSSEVGKPGVSYHVPGEANISERPKSRYVWPDADQGPGRYGEGA